MSVSKAPAYKTALVAALTSIMPAGTLVTYGHPGADSADDMVAVLNLESDQQVGPMSPNRSREETLTVTVMFSCWRTGTDQATVTARAYTLLGLLESYLQDPGVSGSSQITLGGTVRDSRVVAHSLAETEDPDDMALGRLAEISAVVVARVRI